MFLHYLDWLHLVDAYQQSGTTVIWNHGKYRRNHNSVDGTVCTPRIPNHNGAQI